MGEVYKAEDLKLNQTVALKFLPESIALDGGMLAQLRSPQVDTPLPESVKARVRK